MTKPDISTLLRTGHFHFALTIFKFGLDKATTSMVGTRGLHADKKVIPIGAMRGKKGDEVLESIRRHWERQGEEALSLVIEQSGMERRFRDIHTTKKSKHYGTSRCIILDEAERASRSILHSDKGSETQSTDEDTGRQVTDSFKDSRTQELCSSPASFFYHTKYTGLIFNKILCRRSNEKKDIGF
jgi:hypothetical protein